MNIDTTNLPDLFQADVSNESLLDISQEEILEKYAGRFNIYQNDFKSFKFRPHAVGNLMGGIPKPLTERQAETLEAFQIKIDAGKGLTDKQYVDYGSLLEKKNARPTLSTGAKSYLKTLFKEVTFQRTQELKSKYLDKGIACEPMSFDMIREFYGEDFQKNTERFENDFFNGEPDCINGDEVIDIKSSWDYTTFPMFDEELENKMYYWQILAYMDLINAQRGRIIYVLNDTPDEIIYDEKRRVSWQLGLISEELKFDLPQDLEFEIERNLTYADIPREARIKEFVVRKDEKDIKIMKEIISLAREFLNELSENLDNRFTEHLKAK